MILMRTKFGFNRMDVNKMPHIACQNPLMVGTTWRKLSSVYCLSAFRQISGFRTVSDETVLVLTIPIDILADDMRWIYFLCLEYPEQIAAIKAEKRRTSMHKWQ